MSLYPPQTYRKTREIHRYGLASDRPDADNVLPGTLYFSTDTGILERSNGTSWSFYNSVPPVGADGTYLRSDGSVSGWSGLLIADFPEGGLWELNGTDLEIKDANIIMKEDNANDIGEGSLATGRPRDIYLGRDLKAGGSLYERGRTVPIGEWVSVTYNSGNFTGGGSQTWTVEAGDQVTYAYTLLGKTMILGFAINNTSVGGTPNPVLDIAIPGGFTAAKAIVQPARVYDNGTDQIGIAYPTVGGNKLHIQKIGGANMAASTNNTSIQGIHFLEVQ